MLGLHLVWSACESVLVKTLQQLFLLRNFEIWLSIRKIFGKFMCCIKFCVLIMLVSVSFYFRADRFLEDLENEEVNRELCALAMDEMFESWSPEIQEQVLAEWNDWQHSPDKSGYVCDQCGKGFTRSQDLKRHIQSLHSGVKEFTCDKCEKSFATRDILRRHI